MEKITEHRWYQLLTWLQVDEDEAYFWTDKDGTVVYEDLGPDGHKEIAKYDFETQEITIYDGLVWQSFEEEVEVEDES